MVQGFTTLIRDMDLKYTLYTKFIQKITGYFELGSLKLWSCALRILASRSDSQSRILQRLCNFYSKIFTKRDQSGTTHH